MKNNILLISDNFDLSQKISNKLVLLRDCDKISISDFKEAVSIINSTNPGLIFIDGAGDKNSISFLVKFIKSKNISQILVTSAVDYDFIMTLYDEGLDDYISENSDAADYLIKSVNLLKKHSESQIGQRNNLILQNLGVISSTTGFYTETYANEIMEDVLNNPVYSNSVFIILTYDELDRAKFCFEELAGAIKSSIRYLDVIIELSCGKFYIVLSNSDICGAENVIEKIQKKLSGEFRIKAGICMICGMSFKELEQKTASVLTDAMLSTSDYAVYEENGYLTDDDWTLEPETGKKDFKLFKSAYRKKYENVIVPVFFRIKEAYDGKIDGTIVEQQISENQCILHLKSRRQISRLTLVYPGLGKIVIYMTHSGLDSPENKEIVLSLKEVTDSVLSGILETFITDYKTCIES